jgi:sulfatase maturation enzyme AslB (radical SAM superfamily)
MMIVLLTKCIKKDIGLTLMLSKNLPGKISRFLDSRETDEIQIFFVPNYACNFACSYCYQDEYAPVASTLTDEVIDAFFQYIQTEFIGRRKYLTIFGGEPLLDSPNQKKLLKNLLIKQMPPPSRLALLPMVIR